MDSLIKLKAKLDETYKTLANTGKEIFNHELGKFFEEWPEIEAIRWTQYTPHFNDGDPCVFHTHGAYVKIKDQDFGGDHDDGWLDRGEFEYESENYKRVEFLDDLLEAAESFLQPIFGDHVQVTIWRDKDEAQVEDYHHD